MSTRKKTYTRDEMVAALMDMDNQIIDGSDIFKQAAELVANACPAPVLPSVLKSSMDWLDGWCREIPQDHACIKHIQTLLTAVTQQQATIEQQREEVERLQADVKHWQSKWSDASW